MKFKMFRQGMLAAALVVATFTAPVASAELKIGAVNLPRLLAQAPQVKAIEQQLQDEFAPRQRELVAKQTELEGMEERLQRDGAVMGEEQRRNMERDIRDGRRDLARRQNEFVEDLNLRRNEELGKLQRSLLEEVQAFARRSDYDLIVGDGVLFASNAVDVTGEVLASLETAFEQNNR